MPALMIRDDISAEELRRQARRERDGRVSAQLIAIANALDGMDRASARLTGMDRQTLRDCVHRDNAEGIAGLCDRPKPGRMAKASEGQMASLNAIFPARDTGVALVLTRLDTAAMNISTPNSPTPCPPARMRGADGQGRLATAGDLGVPENLSLVFLPPYSPELNPIDRLWLHRRDNRLLHRVFRTTEEVVDSCCAAWNWLLGQTGRIRSLCSYLWLAPVSI